MKKFFYVAAALTLFACGEAGSGSDSEYEGYEKRPTGLYVMYHRQNPEAKQVAKDDKVSINLAYKTMKDSVLWNTKLVQDRFFLKAGEINYIGEFTEELMSMHEGDSATFLTSLDSFYMKTLAKPVPMEWKGQMLKFEVGIRKTQSMEEELAELEKMQQEQAQKDDGMIKEYLAAEGIEAEATVSGLYYIETKKGSGATPQSGQTVQVHYNGTLLDGTKFDSSYDRGEPIEFPLGTGSVIKGWDEGISYMSPGTKATLLIPSHLGYGHQQRGPVIKPFSILKFEVELISVK